MFKKKCSGCAKNIEKGFNFCPYCGTGLKDNKRKEDFGLLGVEDSEELLEEELKLPSGIEKMMNSFIKQIVEQNQMPKENMGQNPRMPKGFSIKISTGKPQILNQVIEQQNKKREVITITQEEMNRRMNLPKVDADSKVKRLGDKIIYELNTPGLKERKDVMITKLASGIEIRAYSDNKCYTKIIPLKVEVLQYQVKDEKLFVELKG